MSETNLSLLIYMIFQIISHITSDNILFWGEGMITQMRHLAALNLLEITPQNHRLQLLVYEQFYEYNLHVKLCLLPPSLDNLAVPTPSGTLILATTQNI